jgi:hypothetical protein
MERLGVRSGCFSIVLAALFFIGFEASTPPAETWFVDDDAPADFSTIQAALNAASDGDTIIVRDGTYTGPGNYDIDFKGKAISLRSENGPEHCIIDAEGLQLRPRRGFIFTSGEGTDSVVDGFTITGGYAYDTTPGGSGGAIFCEDSSPTIINNTITGNFAWEYGGGIYAYYGGPVIDSNTIANNTSKTRGTAYAAGTRMRPSRTTS